jgi:hypothetical protein
MGNLLAYILVTLIIIGMIPDLASVTPQGIHPNGRSPCRLTAFRQEKTCNWNTLKPTQAPRMLL